MFFLGLDQGTSGSRALVLDDTGTLRGYGYRPLARLYPHPDWVEQDPHAVATGLAEAITEAVTQAGCHPREIAAAGLACQRNTLFAWDATTRAPIGHAITWQDLRTAPQMDELRAWPHAHENRHRLGYPSRTYQAALHLQWRMRHEPAFRQAAHAGRLRVGLSALWALNALGEAHTHAMDYALVQAQGVFDFRAGHYWQDWLDWLGFPVEPLPQPVPSIHPFGVLRVRDAHGRTADVPALAMMGDQQAALFGYDCRTPGSAECTHGTASFVDVCVGEHAPTSESLNIYHAWTLPNAPHTFCIEADTTVTGAGVRWLRDNLHMLTRDDELGPLAASVPDSGGVMFVPAFTGLNVPHNDQAARATLFGLSLGHNRAHVARAFLEAIGHQLRAILDTIADESGVRVSALKVGGGLSASDVACQIQADLLGVPVVRPPSTETTARAVALLAGHAHGHWPTLESLPALPGPATTFDPSISLSARDTAYARWQRAIETVRSW